MTDEFERAVQIRLRALADAQRKRLPRNAPSITKRQLLDIAVKLEWVRITALADREQAAGNEGAATTYRTLAEVIPEVARTMTP